MWKLALRNVQRHKARTIMTLLAIIVGVAGLILSGGFVQDIFHQLGELLIHSRSGHIQVAQIGYFDRGSRSPEKFLIAAPEPSRKKILENPAVADVLGRLYFSGLLNNSRSDLPIIGEGVEPDREAKMGSGMVITAGRRLKETDEHGMMVGHGLAHALKLVPGNWVNLIINTPDGALNSLEFLVVGTFQTFSKDYDAHAVRIPLSAARDLLATQGVNTLVVVLKRTEDTEPITAMLGKTLSSSGLEVQTWLKLNDFYAKTVAMYDVQFGVLRIIILLMVLLSVVNSVNMSVFERIGEFGTMMALGNRSRRVIELILMENVIIGLLGAASGVLVGMVLALVITAIGIPMPPPPNADLTYIAHIRIVPAVVAGAFGVGLVATVMAAFLPALRVRRISIVDALRQSI